MCGREVETNKYAWNKIYCGKDCRNLARRSQSRKYQKRYRKLKGNTSLDNSIKNGTSVLSDLSIIMVDGEERIKGAVILKSLIRGMKRNDCYSP